jgi:hypothetical protein
MGLFVPPRRPRGTSCGLVARSRRSHNVAGFG